jgi:hypothetical protein
MPLLRITLASRAIPGMGSLSNLMTKTGYGQITLKFVGGL